MMTEREVVDWLVREAVNLARKNIEIMAGEDGGPDEEAVRIMILAEVLKKLEPQKEKA
jgi:hypothetical protein